MMMDLAYLDMTDAWWKPYVAATDN